MRLIYLLLFIAILLQSCQYEPTGINFVKVDSSYVPAEITIVLPSEMDTIWINVNKGNKISYKLAGEISRLNRVLLFMDSTNKVFDTENNSGDKSEGFFTWNVGQVKDTSYYHTLDMIVTTHSGTNSLADLLGVEGLIYHKKYVLVYYNPNYLKQDSIRFEEVNGQLKLSWNAYPYFGNMKLIIAKKPAHYPFYYDLDTLDNIYTTSYIDDTYIGENAEYKIAVTEDYRNKLVIAGGVKSKEFPVIETKKISRNKTEVTWTKAKYYGSFKNYYINVYTSTKSIEIIQESDINKLSAIIEAPLGVAYNGTFLIKPVNDYFFGINMWEEDFNSTFKIFGGDSTVVKFNEYIPLAASTDNYFYFLKGLGSDVYELYQFDVLSGTIKNTANISKTNYKILYNVSPNGNYILYRNEFGIMLCTKANFPNGTLISNSFFNNEADISKFDKVSVSENGKAVFFSDATHDCFFYDLIAGKYIGKVAKTSNNIAISRNGNYFITWSGVYKIEQNNITLIKSLKDLTFLMFDPTNDDVAIYSEYQTGDLNYHNLKSGEITVVHAMDAYTIRDIDFAKGQIIGYGFNSELFILDMNNNFKVIDRFTLGAEGSFKIKNGIFYHGGGMKWEIK